MGRLGSEETDFLTGGGTGGRGRGELSMQRQVTASLSAMCTTARDFNYRHDYRT